MPLGGDEHGIGKDAPSNGDFNGMEPYGLDPVALGAVVARAIDEIDNSSDAQREALLAELLCTAWGRAGAENQ